MKRLAVLGSTGSIGQSALNLVDLYPERFQVFSLAAGSQAEQLYQQALRYRPSIVSLCDSGSVGYLAERLPGTRILGGTEGVIEAAVHPDVDIVVAGISGAAGLLPTYQSVIENKVVALANKETLVMAGELIMNHLARSGGTLLPVDSEHSALHQCLRGSKPEEVRRLVLTASGGPFLNRPRDSLAEVSVQEALKHPTWEMGPKITIDSATLMNKGLEVIEAHYLFGVSAERISVIIHPQSIVHSMVEFLDGNILAQMSITDMRSAILYALSYPERWESSLPRLNLASEDSLQFFEPDTERFPCLKLAYDALKGGQTYPVVLNAANEVAVNAFLKSVISFTAIPQIISEVLELHTPCPVEDIETVLEVDRMTRRRASEKIQHVLGRG